MTELDEKGLEIDPRHGRKFQARLRLLEGQEIAQQVLRTGLGRLGAQGLEAFGTDGQKILGPLDRAHEEQGPEMLDELAENEAEVIAGRYDAFDEGEDLVRLLVEDGRREAAEQVLADCPEDGLEVLVADVLAAEGHGLVEKALGVAHAAVGGLGDEGQPGGGDGDAFFLRDLHEVVDDVLVGDLAELEMLAAGNDRRRDLVELRRRENEHGVRRRLLERLEKGVEGMRREHVDFVDDEHLGAGIGGLVFDHLADGFDVVDLAVGGAVDLEDVDGAALMDGLAELAGALPVGARVRRGAVDAIEGLGQDAGHGRFAGPPDAGEEVGLGDAARGDGVLDGPDNGQLSDDLLELPGPVFPGEYLVGHGFRPSATGEENLPFSPKK